MPLPQLRAASYRGVSFGLEATDEDTGRRVSIDPLPGRDLPDAQDFGKEPRTITLDAFVVGADYQARALQLLEVCAERDTPGRLSLPYGTSLVVRPTRCVRRERMQELGMARFLLVFVEVERLPAPAKRTDGQRALEAASSALAGAGTQTMAEGLAVKLVPAPVIESAAAEVSAIGTSLGALGAAANSVEDAAALAGLATQMVRDAQALVLEPLALAQMLVDAYQKVADTAVEALASLNAYRDLSTLRPRDHSNYLVLKNATLVANAGRFCAIAGWARAAGQVDWASYEDALTARRELLEAIDEAALVADDLSFAALFELRARVAGQVPPAAKKLPRLRRIQLVQQTSALVLAYRLFDDPTRDAEIVARNHVRHPAFLPVGVPLQVLVDG